MARYIFILFIALLIPSLASAASSSAVGTTATGTAAITLVIPQSIDIREQSQTNNLLLTSNFNATFSLSAVNQNSKKILIENYQLEPRVSAALDNLIEGEYDALIITPN